jgi:tetratricopeptide (TPR) repeat protein
VRLRRQVVFFVASAVLVGSALEIVVSRQVASNFEDHQSFCRSYLCEEDVPLARAYQLQLQGTKGSLDVASGMLLDSLVRDPASAYRWLDLGQVLAQAGRIDQAAYCMSRAAQLGGNAADLALDVGDFYLRYGDRRVGLRYLSKTLSLTRAFDEAVFSRFAARGVSVEEALSDGIRDQRPAAQAYLSYLIDERDTTGAEKTWKWMTDHGLDDQKAAVGYCSFLFTQRRFSQAGLVWASEAGLSPGDHSEEYLYNGSFASEPLPGAIFDWRIAPSEHLLISRDCGQQSDGCSLRIQFDGSTNIYVNNVTQTVVVEPGEYRFRASVRTAEVTTDQGLMFDVRDGENEGRLHVQSTQLKGTSDWQDIEIPFAVGSATNFIDISLRRHPSLRFDNKINGTVWIRRVSLVRLR